MKKTIATLIAGLFATAAFAQTPAPAAPSSTTPQSSVAPAVGKAEAGHEKQATKADTKDSKATRTRSGKKKGVKAKIKTAPEAQKDTAAADTTPTAPAQ